LIERELSVDIDNSLENRAELSSEASKMNRQLAEDEFGGKTVESKRGRKIDLTLRVMVSGGAWKGEVAIFEGKPQVSDKTCQVQQQQSVRLDAAILSHLEGLVLDISKTYLVAAETRALSVEFHTLKRYGEVFGAGKATHRRIWLGSELYRLVLQCANLLS